MSRRNKNRTTELEEEECQKRPFEGKSLFPKHDNIVDIAGYAKCYDMILKAKAREVADEPR